MHNICIYAKKAVPLPPKYKTPTIMNAEKVDMFMMRNADKFPQMELPNLRQRLLALDESQWSGLCDLQFKDPKIVLLISLFFGSIGADRFYLGQYELGILKIITAGGIFLWTIIDWFLIQDAAREKNADILYNYMG